MPRECIYFYFKFTELIANVNLKTLKIIKTLKNKVFFCIYIVYSPLLLLLLLVVVIIVVLVALRLLLPTQAREGKSQTPHGGTSHRL